MKQKGAPEFVIRKVMEKAQDGYGGLLLTVLIDWGLVYPLVI